MPNSTPLANESLDYPFLLITHMVCAEQQIHDETSKALQELASQTQVGQHTLVEMEKILVQDEQRLSVEEVARRVLPNQQGEAMGQILALAYADGFLSPLEREMVEQVAQIWNWSRGELQQVMVEAEGFRDNRPFGDDQEPSQLSIGAILLRGAESILSRALVSKLAELAPKPIGRRLQQLQREILLVGPEYDEAIERCAAIATEDYRLAEAALKEAGSVLAHLGQAIQQTIDSLQQKTSSQGEAITAKDVVKQLETTKKVLTADILQEIERVGQSLRAKQRALNHFSIAFMGKTKAGKSTLHAVITGDGWEAISTGGQRTTRLNRVYEWKHIRMIDTPGIGAPGGKTDEEIVHSVIEESDVICYVVTNDSIQDTEFQFLKQLKEKAKPLIILLNVKHNLRDSQRLESFLNDPDKLFAMDGNSGLRGHIDRIRRYAKEHYANDYFDIIPVMLLAAQMAREPEHQGYKDKLFKASRIQDFLDAIRESVVWHGTIRRSQTLLGSTVGVIEQSHHWLTQQIQVYHQLIETLQTQRQALRHQIQVAGNDHLESLQHQLSVIFQELFNVLPELAEENWNFNEESLKQNWERKLKASRFDERLQAAYQQTCQGFNQDVQEAIEEIGNELKLIAQLGGGYFSFYDSESRLYERDIERVSGGFINLSQTVVTYFMPPVNKTVMMGAFVINSVLGIFKSREEKRRFAQQRVSNLLAPQIRDRQQDTLAEARANFQDYYQYASGSINIYFDGLIQGVKVLAPQFETPRKKLAATTQALNLAYAKRIVDWCLGHYEPLTEQSIHKTITQVKRDFGCRIDIQTKFEVKPRLSQLDIQRILQEEVSLHRIQ